MMSSESRFDLQNLNWGFNVQNFVLQIEIIIARQDYCRFFDAVSKQY